MDPLGVHLALLGEQLADVEDVHSGWPLRDVRKDLFCCVPDFE